MIKRGEIYYADLSPVVGSEQGGVRPVLVVQNDVGNKYSPTVIVAFLTSQMKRLDMKTHVVIQHYPNLRTSVVQTEQMATIDKRDILSIVTKLRPEDMARVDTAVRVSLGLEVD